MADFAGYSPFTGLTATISFMGQDVGELQNLTWSEQRQTVPVQAIGSPIAITIVQGPASYNISARRAFLLADVVASLMDGVDLKSNANTGLITTANTQVKFPSSVGAGGTIPVGDTDLFAAVQNTGSAAWTVQSKLASIYFDILVKDSSTLIGGAGASQSDNVYYFNDCILASRNHSLDVGGIISMEDIQIVSRRRGKIDSSNPVWNDSLSATY